MNNNSGPLGSLFFMFRLSVIILSVLYVIYEYVVNGNAALREEWKYDDYGAPFLIFILLFSVFGVMIILKIQRRVAKVPLQAPSWHSNPFSISQPFQIYHIGSLALMIVGLTHIIMALIKYGILSDYGVFMSLVGIGTRVGIGLAASGLKADYEGDSRHFRC